MYLCNEKTVILEIVTPALPMVIKFLKTLSTNQTLSLARCNKECMQTAAAITKLSYISTFSTETNVQYNEL